MSVHSDQSLRDLNLIVTSASSERTLWRKISHLFALWRQRTRTRRFLAKVNMRSLAEAGISPAAAAYESGKPFWRSMGSLR